MAETSDIRFSNGVLPKGNAWCFATSARAQQRMSPQDRRLIYSVPINLIARAAAFLASSSEAESSAVTMLRVMSPETERPFGVKLARQIPGFR
jgi:hypothetical protein